MTDTNATARSFDETLADALDAVPADQMDPDRFGSGVGPLSTAVTLVGEAPGTETTSRRSLQRIDEAVGELVSVSESVVRSNPIVHGTMK